MKKEVLCICVFLMNIDNRVVKVWVGWELDGGSQRRKVRTSLILKNDKNILLKGKKIYELLESHYSNGL